MFRFFIIFLYFLAYLGNLHGEKEKIIIRKLDLEGNETISLNEILYIVRQRPPTFFFRQPEFNSRLLKLDALTIKNYYHSKGFLDVDVRDSYKIIDNKADIFFKIDEGKRYYLNKVKIIGNVSLDAREIEDLLGLKLYQPYNPVAINDNLNLLENKYHELGKLFFTIEVQDVVQDSINVNINIKENNNVYINNTFFENTGNIDSTVILRELTYEKGDLYTKTEMDRTLNNLKEIGIFSMVNLIPVRLGKSDSLVNLVFEFRRYKQREWYSTGGYDPISFAEGSPELPALSATIEWRNRAVLNTPKQFFTKLLVGIPVEADFVNPRIRYDAGFSSNWFMRIRIPTSINGYYERLIIYEGPIYNESINRFGTNLTQRFHLRNRSYIENKIIWEEFSDESSINIQERSLLSKIHLDYKDNPLFTSKGYLISMMFKTTGFGGSREYYKMDLTLQTYYPIISKSIFAMRFQAGRMWNWNEKNDLYYEKFYLGGSTSMRGWDVLKFSLNEGEPNGETIRLMTNMELRNNIYKTFGITVFTDGGILTDQVSNISFPNFKWDAGLGITLKTPLGPFRVDYAIRLNENNEKRIQLGFQNLF